MPPYPSATWTISERDAYTLILSNPPFTDSVFQEEISKDLLTLMKTRKTELLFCSLFSLFIKMLNAGGRCASIVPDGVLFGSSKAHKELRKELVGNQQLIAVISMPSDMFKPYTKVSTAILVFTKTNADGFSLDDKRSGIAGRDIPDIIARFHNLDDEVERERTEQSFLVPKQEIVENGYDLSLNKYKKTEYVPVEYPLTSEILDELDRLEADISAGLEELRGAFVASYSNDTDTVNFLHYIRILGMNAKHGRSAHKKDEYLEEDPSTPDFNIPGNVESAQLDTAKQTLAIDKFSKVCYCYVRWEECAMELHQDCGLLIKQINDELRKNGNNALRSQGMTLTQLDALAELDQAPEGQRSLKELEQILHVAQSTAAGIIARLEQKGLVEGIGDAGDRRIKRVQITPAGVECVRTALHHRAEAEEKLLSSLTETERGIFFVLLKKVRDSL